MTIFLVSYYRSGGSKCFGSQDEIIITSCNNCVVLLVTTTCDVFLMTLCSVSLIRTSRVNNDFGIVCFLVFAVLYNEEKPSVVLFAV